jgi:membrane associated rhomboid family serine protease
VTDTPEGPAEAPEAAAEPITCYRHPDREAHIRCVRCNRRICPDCMVSASVGFQCPECVREGNKGQRSARTQFGGRLSDDPGYVSKVLIGINVVVFVLQQASASFENHLILVGDALDPSTGQAVGVAEGEYYRLLTSAFMHANILHIVLNMYALFLFGPPLEHVLGRARFTALYLVAALGGSAASYAFNAPNVPSLGASGAVFGLFGAFFVINRRLGRENGGLLVLIAINLVFGFVVPHIDWHGHLGGLAAGTLTTVAMAYAPRRSRLVTQVVGTAVVLALVVLVVVVRTAQLT